MAIEPRQPPRNFVMHLRRALGGRAGWSGFAAQLAFVAFVIWLGYEIYSNAQANLQAQRIATGFGFLQQHRGLRRQPGPDPVPGIRQLYRACSSSVLLNTLLVSVIGIFFATILGFIVGLGRLSPNWLVAAAGGRLCRTHPQPAASVPDSVLVLAVLSTLPSPRQSVSLFGMFFLNNRGLIVPTAGRRAGLRAVRFRVACLQFWAR